MARVIWYNVARRHISSVFFDRLSSLLFASTGSMFVSSLEVGGIIGSVSAGFVADRLVALVSLLTYVQYVA
jgi:hypothetical protein